MNGLRYSVTGVSDVSIYASVVFFFYHCDLFLFGLFFLFKLYNKVWIFFLGKEIYFFSNPIWFVFRDGGGYLSLVPAGQPARSDQPKFFFFFKIFRGGGRLIYEGVIFFFFFDFINF